MLKNKINFIDRAISWIAPTAAMRRMQARNYMALVGGYTGAKKNRRQTQTWHPINGSADNATIDDLPILRERSRDLLRNAPLAIGAVNTVITNVVGTGLKPQSHIDRNVLRPFLKTDDAMEKWEEKAEEIFNFWATNRDCDLTRGQNFAEMQSLILRSALESGDVFVLRKYKKRKNNPFGTTLQIIEADRIEDPYGISTTDTVAGIKLDKDGAPVSYSVANRNPDDHDQGELVYVDVPAFDHTGNRQMLHIFNRTRPDMTRGVPYLAPVIESLKQLDRYTEAEIMAAVISSMFTIFVKTESEEGLAPMMPLMDSTHAPDTRGGDYKLSPGAILDLQPSESIEIADPKRPNQAFDGFVQSILRQVGVALELPFEILIKHFTASYSAAQAALVEAWKTFSTRRKWLANQFCQPAYEMVITEAIASGLLDAPGFFSDPFVRAAYLKVEWIGPPRGQIDQLKEIRAAEYRVDLGISTLEEETAQLTGGNWETKHTQRAREHKMRIDANLE